MKNYYIILPIFFFTTFNCFSQEYKFGKITKEELLEKSYPLDTTANAAVLYENKTVTFDLQSNEFITEVFVRLKIYNKKGLEYGTKKIVLNRSKNNKDRIDNLKAYTYNITSGEIEKVKLEKKDIFNKNVSKYRNETVFTMPLLKEGSVIEYKYKIVSPYFRGYQRISLQKDIPIKKIDFVLKMPEFLNLRKRTTGYLPIKINETTTSGRLGSGSGRSFPYTINNYIIKSKNIPSFKYEPHSGNVSNYISSIIFELQSINLPNRPIQNFSTTWEAVTKKIYSSINFGGELKRYKYFQKDIDDLLSDVTEPSKKASKIYDYVKNKMVWNQIYSVFTNEGVEKAYKNGTGNVSEINLMLTSMLSYAGVDANPVIVSSSYRTVALFPTITGFDYVICRVKLPDDTIFYLDATDKYGLPDVLPDRVIRGIGRVMAENGTSQVVNLRPSKLSLNRSSIQCEINEDGLIDGKLNLRYLSHFAHDYRTENGDRSNEEMINSIKEKHGLSNLSDYSIDGIKDFGKGVSESFSFEIDSEVELIEDEIYFSPLLFLRDRENIFKSDDRDYPVDYNFGFSKSIMVNIEIPEGYELTEIPKSGAFKLPDNLGSFTYRANFVNGMIQVMVNKTINEPIISQDYYAVLKEFYNQVIQKEEEQIVLKKV